MQSVDEIRYIDSAGDVHVLSTDVYVVSGLGGDVARISLAQGQSWPLIRRQDESVILDLTVGYGESVERRP